jgi:iron complex transport system permease protein
MSTAVQVEGLAQGRGAYRRLARRKLLLLGVLAVLLLASLVADLTLGPARYSYGEVVRALLGMDVPLSVSVVVWEIRLPVALMAVVVGAALAVSGAQMQTVLNNPLASPFTLGISAAAGFGAALGFVLGVSLLPAGWSAWTIPANAFVSAMGCSLLIHFLSKRRGMTTETIVLLGIALVFTFNAALSALEFIASEQALAAVVFWTMGSLGRTTWMKLGIATTVLVAIWPLFARQAWALTALRLGEHKGRQLRHPGRAAAVADHPAGQRAGVHLRLLRRHHRLHRAGGAAHRPHAGGRGPALLPAGFRAGRRAGALRRLRA